MNLFQQKNVCAHTSVKPSRWAWWGAFLSALLCGCVAAASLGCGDNVVSATGPGKAPGTIEPATTTIGLPASLTCGMQSFTGAGMDACTVTMTAAASTGQVVTLSSDNPAVTVPATVTVPANATIANFTATVAAVSSAQTATVTATSDGISKPFTLRLSASVVAASPALMLSTSSVAFGNVAVNSAATAHTVTLTSSGTGALTISAVTVSGAEFSIGGTAFPVTLNPGQTATISIQFNPSAAGAVTGKVTISTNDASGNSDTISLTGTGTTSGGTTGGGNGGGSGNGGSSGSTAQPAVTGPTPGSVLSGSAVTFTWTTASGVTDYQLFVGTTAVGSDDIGIYSRGATTASTESAAVTGIPVSGAILYVRLFTYLAASGAWQASDYTYLEASSAAFTPTGLGSLSCSSASVVGAGTDSCTVTVSPAAPAGGVSVILGSNNSAVTVPATVTVGAGASSAAFTANVAAVSAPQAVTLTASLDGASSSYVLQLALGTPALTLGATSIAFGGVALNTPVTKLLSLKSSGTAPLTISGGSALGLEFSIGGVAFPVTLNPGQTATLHVQFDPNTAGEVTGILTLTSNASAAATATVILTGTGGGSGGSASQYAVALNWNAPVDSTDPNQIAGYNIYRAPSGTAGFQLLNPSVNAPTTYTDNTVANGSSYDYEVTTVDVAGNESAPSNIFTASIPSD